MFPNKIQYEFFECPMHALGSIMTTAYEGKIMENMMQIFLSKYSI
jgi:hypothetical protein